MATHEYDRELGRITEQDREYAREILDDIADYERTGQGDTIELIAQWLRKVRYEAVIADHAKRSNQ